MLVIILIQNISHFRKLKMPYILEQSSTSQMPMMISQTSLPPVLLNQFFLQKMGKYPDDFSNIAKSMLSAKRGKISL
jgi:hypothetical protein